MARQGEECVGKIFLLSFYLSESSSLVQRVTSDGQEDIEESVVPTQCQHDKVQGVHQSALSRSALRVDGVVHDLVPVLPSQNLSRQTN